MATINDTVTLGVRADTTGFERDIMSSYSKLSGRIKPLNLRLNNGMSQPLGKITADVSQFSKSLDAASARVVAFSSTVGIINGVVSSFRALVRETTEVEKALADINSVLNTSQKNLENFGDSLYEIARNTASSFKEVSSAAVEFSRQGLTIQQTLKATNAALLLSRISGLDAAESVKALTSSINGFNKEALTYEQIVNRLANVDSNFAVSTKDIAEALTRVGSTASEAGVSFNELVAAVTAVQQTTSRGGAVIGNALKSIFTRTSRESTITQLRELGVAIDESQNGIEKLRAIASAINKVDKSTANTIKELAGGVFQINVVTAALGDLSREYSVYDNALKIANNSTNEAIRRNEELNKTISALASQAGTNISELLSKVGKISFGGNLKSLLGEFNGIVKGLVDTLDGDSIGSSLGKGIIQGLGNFIVGPGGIALIGFFGKVFWKVAQDSAKMFQSLSGITSESEKQAQIQSVIAQRLGANAAQYERQLLTGKGIVGIQQEILSGLRAEAEMRAAIARVSASMSKSVSPYFNVKNGTILNKASGYVPALANEQRSILAGVGGATPNSRPVVVPRFNFGNSVGPVVANTSEKIVENWMGGNGSAILNKDMISALGGESSLGKFGKVRNLAEGFVPNLRRPDSIKGPQVRYEGAMDFTSVGKGMMELFTIFGFGLGDHPSMSTVDRKTLESFGIKIPSSLEAGSKFPYRKGAAEGFIPSLASYELAGGKVNLRKRGGDLVLDEILAGFDDSGNRMSGTGIVRQAFDLAIGKGKEMGANNLVVDIINSKIASSLNGNPRFSAFGKFGIGKYKLPLASFAEGLVPSFSLGLDALNSFGNPKELLKYVKSVSGTNFHKGSSRAFIDLGEGRGLKIALNRAGIAQNEREFPILNNDYFAREQYGDILPAGFGFDENNYHWGIVEKLGKVGAADFRRLSGEKKSRFGYSSKWRGFGFEDSAEGSFGYQVNEFLNNYGLANDFQGGRNIGLGTDGKLKLMDVGFDEMIARSFYGKNRAALRGFASGYVPSSALSDAISREVGALVNLGYPADMAKTSIRVGSSSALSDTRNPLGLGVYNTAQGQTSLSKAMADHAGQNLKTVGKANGFIPSLAMSSDESLPLGHLAARPGGVEGFIKGLDISNINLDVQEKALRKNIQKAVENALNVNMKSLSGPPKKAYQALVREIIEVRGPDIEAAKTIQRQQSDKAIAAEQAKIDRAIKNNAAIADAEKWAAPLQERADFENTVRKSVAAGKVRQSQNFNSFTSNDEASDRYLNMVREGQAHAKAFNQSRKVKGLPSASADVMQEIEESVIGKLNERGLFSFKSSKSLLSKEAGFAALSAADQSVLREKLGKASSMQRREAFSRAGMTMAFAGSMATPFLDMGADSLRKSGNNGAAGAISTASGVVSGASMGAMFGPWGMAVGALAGGVVALGKAADGSANKAERLSETLDRMSGEISSNLNAFNSYVQTQQKLNDVIDSGGKKSDISQIQNEMTNVFSSISDPKLRQDIIATGGDLNKLSEAFARAQSEAFGKKSIQEAVTFAAQEKAKNTNFMGIRTERVFSARAIGDISRNIISGADKEKLGEFSETIKNLGQNVSNTDFTAALKKIGVSVTDASSLFEDLETPLNRLLLLRGLKENIDLTEEFKKSSDGAIRYKAGLTDLNKTIGSLVALNASASRTDMGFKANAFSLNQNAAQLNAGLMFPNLSQFAQAQLASAFQAKQISFNSQQEKQSVSIDLTQSVAAALEQNREKLAGSKDLIAELDTLINNGGNGDILGLAKKFSEKGLGSGEDYKAYSEIGKTLLDAGLKLETISDNEKTQIETIRQNTEALKKRTQIEAKANVLGGSEGILGFSGFDRFRNRDAYASMSKMGGELGSFGMSERALGILEMQKTLGGVDGLDIRKLIPDAQSIVEKALYEKLTSSFGRMRIPLTNDSMREIDSISKIAAAKSFEKKELTADDIGAAVGASIQYDTFGKKSGDAFNFALSSSGVSTNVGFIKDIQTLLENRFGVQKERVDNLNNVKVVDGKIQEITSKINNLNADSGRIKADSNNLVFGDTGWLGGVKNSEELRKYISDVVNNKGLFNFGAAQYREPLLQQFGSKFTINASGEREVTDEILGKIIDSLKEAGMITVKPEALQQIAENSRIANELSQSLQPLNSERDSYLAKDKEYEQRIAAIDAKKTISPSFPLYQFGPAQKSFDWRNSFGWLAPQTAKPTNENDVELGKKVAYYNSINATRDVDRIKFGNFDVETATKYAIAQNDRKVLTANKQDTTEIDKSIRSLETVLLRQAQYQQLKFGEADPALKSLGFTGGFKENSRKIASNTAIDSFDSMIAEINESFVNGFASKADMTKIGIRISESLDQYVSGQVKLGVSEEEARKEARAIREKLQKQLDKLDGVNIKIASNGLKQFGQGFASGLEQTQQSLNRFGDMGDQVQRQLVDGFGDAFVQVASGAENARAAVGNMLSSIAADLAKFFAKRAFASIFSAAVNGTASASSNMTSLYAQGGQTGGEPALVMGGERAFSPETVRAYGVDFFHDLNAGKIQKKAGGGQIQGGSGYKDDIFTHFPSGTYVLQKAAVNKYGKSFLDSIDSGAKFAEGGQVQRAFWGALIGQIFSKAVQGAVVGGVTAKLTGGSWKKGAMLGAVGGAIAGGISGYGYAKQNPNAGFMDGFGKGFSWMGFGGAKETSANGTPGSGIAGMGEATTYEDFIKNHPDSSAAQYQMNSGGLGNQSVTAADTAAKPSLWKNAGASLLAGLALTGISSAMAKKPSGSYVDGHGSVTTYNSDGSVTIQKSNGDSSVIKRGDYNTSKELESLVSMKGGKLPMNGVSGYANGGEVASGSGAVSYKERSAFSRAVPIPEFKRPSSPVITTGSGTRDDVAILGKRGEFIMSNKAVDHYGTGFMNRLNSLQLSEHDTKKAGILTMSKGGIVEYNPSDRDRGIFSLSGDDSSRGGRGRGGASSNSTNVSIVINMNNGGGEASVSSSTSKGSSGKDDKSSVDSQKFAAKVKTMFMELIEQEKRPGGSLHKESMK